MNKILIAVVAATFALPISCASAGLIFTAIVDSPSSVPRVIEVMATADIDAADFFFVRQTNGNGNISSFSLSDTSMLLNAGEFGYISFNSTTFLNDNSLGPILRSTSSFNGDDIFGIATSDQTVAAASEDASDLTDIIDSFGLFGQADTDFYADSIALRNSSSTLATGTGVLDATNFEITSLASEVDAETAALANLGTFSLSTVPEPSSLTYALIFGLSVVGPRRRR